MSAFTSDQLRAGRKYFEYYNRTRSIPAVSWDSLTEEKQDYWAGEALALDEEKR